MQQQRSAPPTCLVPNPKNPRVLVTQEAAQKIREELEVAAKASPPVAQQPKQTYVAPLPKTGQSAKPKYSAPPILLRRGSAPPPLGPPTETSTHSEQKTVQTPEPSAVAAMPGHEGVRPNPVIALLPPATRKIQAPQVLAQPRPAPLPETVVAKPAKQPNNPAVNLVAPAPPRSPGTKKVPKQKKVANTPDEGSVAIVPPTRADNVPDEPATSPQPITFDDDLIEALLNE